MSETATSEGWFDDPHDSGQLRWWDGSQWTEHVAPRPEVQPEPQPHAAPTALQVVAPVAIPSLPAHADGAPAVPQVAATTPSRGFERPSNRTLAIVGGALVLVVALAVANPMLRGESDPTPESGPTTTSGAEIPAATAPTGAPLSPQDYATKVKAINDAGSGQFEAAQLRAARDQLAAINPPAEVAAEHQALVTHTGELLTAVEQGADETGQMKSLLAYASALETIEQKLGVPLATTTTETVSATF